MKKIVEPSKKPKDLLKSAMETASEGNVDKAFEIFEQCIREYQKSRDHFKALAVAKIARSALGDHPRAHALLIRLFSSMDLSGDAHKEFEESSRAWKKDIVPIFRGLNMDEFMGILEVMQIFPARKGKLVLKQDEAGEDIFIVITGRLSVTRDGEHLSTMLPGDVFGEIGFFSRGKRSASVRAEEHCELVRIPSRSLRELSNKYPGLGDALEELYNMRVVKKASEDLKGRIDLDLDRLSLSTVQFPKGREILFDGMDDVSIIKHGVVEVTYENRCVREKRFIKPGSVIGPSDGYHRASTDVELINVRMKDKAEDS